jgi:hypothetical protein
MPEAYGRFPQIDTCSNETLEMQTLTEYSRAQRAIVPILRYLDMGHDGIAKLSLLFGYLTLVILLGDTRLPKEAARPLITRQRDL